MSQIKEGDYVGRISYDMDIIFVVSRIIDIRSGEKLAILKGFDIRIEADSFLDDLKVISKKEIINREEKNNLVNVQRIKSFKKRFAGSMYKGKILHLDGDYRYSQKSYRYYKSLELNAVVRNIPESRQSKSVVSLIKRFKPDILVITGHDAMLKKRERF